ncbi:PIN2/TERF1-interacting telomerase inhibitor 1 67-11-3 protein [Channa argus]|uniref:PIN2/TERF1-interacting telomerase inhibitor 1 67-11-3 protein n=1 Tax=Channa argus TaxID=215402 RepID=A0A6G1QKG0_CHAAH|nr:PIN2/TERF1-interacting telomerase inhibitor 1 67-11-3 protein [Channa argus]KAK2890220.1 hypothetical protein Q8A73_018520 [Channa argus]
MSMLAETRRKQKWSVDPRNSTWSNDDSKFGQKMLERMGWSKGKGLGRSEQGSTDHIKVKVKNNNYGLGANASHEDNWIAHQDDFNELLAQLNNCHGQNNSNEPPADEKKGFSLEEKSKTSKKRVHYMKFTKGKDLSSRSETDLNCIFGKRSKSAKDQVQDSNSSEEETEANVTTGTSEVETESITKTVTSTLTMQEYFAQRMAKLKKAQGQPQNSASSVPDNNKTSSPSEEPSPIHSSSDDTEEPKKKKNKKRNKKAMDEVEIVKDRSTSTIVVEDSDNLELQRSRKMKKRKVVKNEEATDENSTSGVKQYCEELPPSKKKKLKKHSKEADLLNGHGPTDDQALESDVVQKKKKKHKDEVDHVVEEDTGELVQKKSKKDKKKKKKHQE